jgi:WD40 repeat protein
MKKKSKLTVAIVVGVCLLVVLLVVITSFVIDLMGKEVCTVLRGYGGDSFNAVAWHPSGKYAVMVGNNGAVFKYDEKDFTDLSKPFGISSTLRDIDWHPSGEYALIVGGGLWDKKSIVLRYDGESFMDLSPRLDAISALEAIDWHPSGDYALIVGEIIVKYDGSNFTDLTKQTNDLSWCEDIQWKPNGGYALLSNGLKYDGGNFTKLSYGGFRSISWREDESYAILIRGNCGVWKYDGKNFTDLSSKLPSGIRELCVVSWTLDDSYALIGTTRGTMLKYDGNKFIDLKNRIHHVSDIAWKPDGSYALLVNGAVLKYPQEEGETFIPGFETSVLLLAVIGACAAIKYSSLYTVKGG